MSSPRPSSPGMARPTLIALMALVPASLLALFLGQRWTVASEELAAFQTQMTSLQKENQELSRYHRFLDSRKFEVCNLVQDGSGRFEWLAAARPERDRMAVFDSAACDDWASRPLKSGKTELQHPSALPGCNWDGSVAFVAASWIVEREDEEGELVFHNFFVGSFATEIEGCFKVR